MCNRYASEIRKAGLEREFYGFEEWSETGRNTVLEVFPKSVGPVIGKRKDGSLGWTRMRWGLPGPSSTGGAPVTNIRNIASPHWRPLLGPAHRCLVPFTAFSEYEDASPKGTKIIKWFAPPNRGMLMFAGIWRSWSGDYGSKKEPNIGDHLLYSFLTTEPNSIVRPVHAKAMPVILATSEAQHDWLNAPAEEVATIQSRALPDEALEILTDEEASAYAGAYIK
ncbi:MAG TPA: SOS response-associated peptidase family protein [Verrucomicrobiae bacterium]|nr:SOS response-associated peptidase family protein [Verrucomicrobiae bacterium]